MPRYVTPFGEWLRARRRELGLTLRQVGHACGCSVPYLSDVEREQRPPPPPGGMVRYRELAALLGVTPDAVLRRVRDAREPILLGVCWRRRNWPRSKRRLEE